ncbi:hypothetical protein EDD85DRAFT_797592 [Armillaria nabsnona]|nr:hypothetical protein EDD85DRAFT_797592 [Armillaria nabsnona]
MPPQLDCNSGRIWDIAFRLMVDPVPGFLSIGFKVVKNQLVTKQAILKVCMGVILVYEVIIEYTIFIGGYTQKNGIGSFRAFFRGGHIGPSRDFFSGLAPPEQPAEHGIRMGITIVTLGARLPQVPFD